MFENLTDGGQLVMKRAEKFARDRGDTHLGTEHILMGLMQAGLYLAAQVLKDECGLATTQVYRELEKIADPRQDSLPDHEPLTPDAYVRRLMSHATEEAHVLGDPQIASEHILLGLLKENDSVGAQVLLNCGLKLEAVRDQVLHLLGCNLSPWELLRRRFGREIKELTGYYQNTTGLLIISLVSTQHIPRELTPEKAKRTAVLQVKEDYVEVAFDNEHMAERGIRFRVAFPRSCVVIVTAESINSTIKTD